MASGEKGKIRISVCATAENVIAETEGEEVFNKTETCNEKGQRYKTHAGKMSKRLNSL